MNAHGNCDDAAIISEEEEQVVAVEEEEEEEEQEQEEKEEETIYLQETHVFNRGGAHPQLILEERVFVYQRSYVLKSTGVEVDYYECNKCRKKRLVVSAHVDTSEYRRLLSQSGEHTPDVCMPDPDKIVELTFHQRLISQAKSVTFGSATPSLRSLFTTERSQVPPEDLAALPGFNPIVRSLQRARQSVYPPLPIDLATFREIPQELLTMGGTRESFLLYFGDYREANGSMSTLLMFGTKSSCQRLASARRIFCDGTFKVVPAPFHDGHNGQFFTLSSLFGARDSEFLCTHVGVLCPHKSEAMYIALFEILFAECEEQHNIPITEFLWENITIDFEESLRKAIEHISATKFHGQF